jgi:Big-like domain-containing protein
VQYHNIGSYESDTGTPITQEITRQTVWSVLTSGIATISAGGINAGQVLGVAQGTTTVEASVGTTNSNLKIPQLYSPLNVSPLTQQ